jgi:TonB family protein
MHQQLCRLFTVLIGLAIVARINAQQTPDMLPAAIIPDNELPKYAVFRPHPEYPREARARHITGEGMFGVEISLSTGRVNSVRIIHSTGSAILDKAAIQALKNWRFRPNTFRQARVPINFTMDRPRDAR